MFRMKFLGAFLGALAWVAPAQAVTTTIDIVGPSSVPVGSTQQFIVNYSFDDLPLNYTHASGSASYFVDSIALGSTPLNPNGGSFVFSYTFGEVSDYLLRVSGSINFYNTTYEFLYSHTYRERCGWFRTCTYSYPVYGNVTRNVGSDFFSEETTISAVSAVPLPASSLLLIGALGALVAARRRKTS
ncbi:VPLPA-CTERM sorting domain-containing protein [Tabrizicola sp. WMC-M-20]|nr:VPLPA-CTERM sorting domain-containing protein [Tabrizicola sp. WMC-M-20]